MTRYFLFVFIFCALSSTTLLFAQNYGISDDGTYVFGELYTSSSKAQNVFAIRSTLGPWYKEITGARNISFGNDDKELCYQKNGRLFILRLGTDKLDSLDVSTSYILSGKKKQFLLYMHKTDSQLIVLDMRHGNKFSLKGCTDFFLHPDLEIFYAQINEGGNHRLLQVDLNTKKQYPLGVTYSSNILSKKLFSEKGDKLAFFIKKGEDCYIWLQDIPSGKVELISQNMEIFKGKYKFYLDPSYTLVFDRSINLIFEVTSPSPYLKTPYLKDVEDLSSYLDAKPNFYWRADIQRKKRQLVSLNLSTRKLIFIERDNELAVGSNRIRNSGIKLQVINGFALVYQFDKEILSYDEKGNVSEGFSMGEFNFNKHIYPNVILVNLYSGERKLIANKVQVKSGKFPSFHISPTGKHILFFDTQCDRYAIYDLLKNSTNFILPEISGFTISDRSESDFLQQLEYNALINTQILWIDGGKAMLINDKFGDIWKVSFEREKPECLTEGLGKLSGGMVFNFSSKSKNLSAEDEIIIIGNRYDSSYFEQSGIYVINLSGEVKLKTLLPMGGRDLIFPIKKAKKSLMYIWMIENIDHPQTFYFGKILSKGVKLVKREEKFDSVNQELVTWKGKLGFDYEGLLLFPKNFDPNIKYPVIVNYYNKIGTVAPSLFIDHFNFRADNQGYLLFIPSLKFRVGYTSASVTDAIVEGVTKLINKPYVDAGKIGIFGGSFGGYETNILIGQTNLFAAAYSIAGTSNLTSLVGVEDLDKSQRIQSSSVINGQKNIGVSLWERPDLYLASSPIFYADRVNCPVLMYHGKQDYRVPFAQGMELYKALKANGKRVWMISNENDDHAGSSIGSFSSYIRARQFFGHYLKDEPAPYWMTRSALEILEKGLNPYDYDPEIKTPGEGILPKEKTYAPQVEELLKHRTTVDKNGRIVDVKPN